MPLTRSHSEALAGADSPQAADGRDGTVHGADRPSRSDTSVSDEHLVLPITNIVTQRMDAWEACQATQVRGDRNFQLRLPPLIPTDPSTVVQVPLEGVAKSEPSIIVPGAAAASGVHGVGASSTHSSLGAVDLPTFDGTITSDAYRIQLGTIAVVNSGSDRTKARILVTKLRGRATELLQNLPTEHLGTYSVLPGLLADHCGSSGNPSAVPAPALSSSGARGDIRGPRRNRRAMGSAVATRGAPKNLAPKFSAWSASGALIPAA